MALREAETSLPSAGPLGRMIVGYLLACAAAAILLPMLFFLRDLVAIGPSATLAGLAPVDLISFVVLGFCMIAVFAAPFATALAVVAQSRRLRHPAVFAVAGAVIGPLVGAIAALMPAAHEGTGGVVWGAFAVYALLGIVAGLIYWSWAVRRRAPR